jgi:hypothetical protein
MSTSRRSPDEAIYQLKVSLKRSKPPIWRRLQVSSNITLYRLHQIIQVAMGWANYHLYEFESRGNCFGEPDSDWDWGREIKSARRTRLSQLVAGEKSRFAYIYDLGDHWEHEILVEKISSPEPDQRYPLCLTGKRACPPEDCGGIWGYEELLEIISDPNHEDHQERMEWLGGQFDPQPFSVERVNRALRRIR